MSDENTIDIVFSEIEETPNTNKASQIIDKARNTATKRNQLIASKNNRKSNSLLPLTSDTSLSFLENPFDNDICIEINNTYLKLKEFDNVEKLFFPKLLYERFDLQNIEKIPGDYLIHKSTTNEVKYLVVKYPITMTYDSKSIIVLGRKEWEDFMKKKEKKEYLQAVKNGESYEKHDSVESERRRMLNKQIKEKLNFFFVETSDDLKSFVESLDYKKAFKPCKQFSKRKSKDLFYSLILSVVGVNKLVAKAITEEFKDLQAFMELGESTDLTKIEYFVDGNVKNVPKSVEMNIKKFFFFEHQDELIYN